MLAVVCPGQGSEFPGMFTPWVEQPALRGRLEELSEVAELDLVEMGTTAAEEVIRDPRVAQPLLLAAAVISLEALLDDRAARDVVDVTAGHSVGEIGACVVAGVLDASAAMMLARERGRAMAAVGEATSASMSVIVGGATGKALAAIGRHGLAAAAVNGPGHVVAAGEKAALAALAAEPPTGARVVPLDVAGAFHTKSMVPAAQHVRHVAAALKPRDPEVALLSTIDGSQVTSGDEVLKRIVAQIARPVRWDLCSSTLAARGVTAMIELLPGGFLTEIADNGSNGVQTVALRTLEDHAAARQLISGGDR